MVDQGPLCLQGLLCATLSQRKSLDDCLVHMAMVLGLAVFQNLVAPWVFRWSQRGLATCVCPLYKRVLAFHSAE